MAVCADQLRKAGQSVAPTFSNEMAVAYRVLDQSHPSGVSTKTLTLTFSLDKGLDEVDAPV